LREPQMELVEGRTLADWIEGGVITLERRITT
jgi:hypothetical protein